MEWTELMDVTATPVLTELMELTLPGTDSQILSALEDQCWTRTKSYGMTMTAVLGLYSHGQRSTVMAQQDAVLFGRH